MTTRLAQSKWRSLDTLFNVGTLGVLSDPELLECFLTDREAVGQEAFRILVERHGPMVLGLCRSLVHDSHEAEDAFQATFLVLARKGHAIWVRDSLGPWLYGVAARIARRARRSTWRRRCEVKLGDDIACTGTSPAHGRGTEQVIHEEIARLPASLRAPIVLCALEGLSYDAAARQLGVTEPTLRGRLHRARRRLAARLREQGVAAPLAASAVEPVHLGVPALPSDLVQSTVRHSVWWSSVSELVAAESAIPASIGILARDALRSMLLHTCKIVLIVALLTAGVVGTVVSAQHGKNPPPAAPVPIRPVRPRDEPALGAGVPVPQTVPQPFRTFVAGHEENLRQIRTLKCVIDHRVSIDEGQTWTDLETLTVRKSGPRERVHHTRHRILNPNRTFELVKVPRGETDVLFAPDGTWSMDGYDPANPPQEPITMRHELYSNNRIGGLIRPPQPVAIAGYKTSLAADYLLLTLVDVMYSLRDLCETELNAANKPVERRDTKGHTLWDLQLKAPAGHLPWDVRHEMPDGKYYSYLVTLSPSHGYAIVESDRVTRVEKGAGVPALEIHDTHHVVEFQEPAPGIFLARRIRKTRTRSDRTDNPQFMSEIIIHDVQVNGPVTDKDLAFRFPRGIGVGDAKKGVHYIWGDGKPTMTLTTEQYNEWRQQEMRRAQGQVIE